MGSLVRSRGGTRDGPARLTGVSTAGSPPSSSSLRRLRQAHLRQRAAHEASLLGQLAQYAKAFEQAGFQLQGAVSPATGAEPCAWQADAVLLDPTSGLSLVLQARLVTTRPRARCISHRLEYELSVRAPQRPDVLVMTFELCSFSESEEGAAEVLAQSPQDTPSSLMLYFADQALGR